MSSSQENRIKLFDRKAKLRDFSPGDQVMAPSKVSRSIHCFKKGVGTELYNFNCESKKSPFNCDMLLVKAILLSWLRAENEMLKGNSAMQSPMRSQMYMV